MAKNNCNNSGKSDHQYPKCEKTLKPKCRLLKHIKSHEREERICAKCNRKFKGTDHFEKHVQTCTIQLPLIEHVCGTCSEKFSRADDLERHLRSCFPLNTDDLASDVQECIQQLDNASDIDMVIDSIPLTTSESALSDLKGVGGVCGACLCTRLNFTCIRVLLVKGQTWDGPLR